MFNLMDILSTESERKLEEHAFRTEHRETQAELKRRRLSTRGQQLEIPFQTPITNHKGD